MAKNYPGGRIASNATSATCNTCSKLLSIDNFRSMIVNGTKYFQRSCTECEYKRHSVWRATPEGRAKALCNAARNSAKNPNSNRRRGGILEFNLTSEWVEKRIIAGRCEVTGIPFILQEGDHPFAPSLDRIDPMKGYTKDNVKVVVFIYNTAKQQFTHEDVITLSKAVLSNYKAPSFNDDDIIPLLSTSCTKEEFVTYLHTVGGVNPGVKEESLNLRQPILYAEILSTTDAQLPFQQRLWSYFNGPVGDLICPACKERQRPFRGFTNGFSQYCSRKCCDMTQRKDHKSIEPLKSYHGGNRLTKEDVINIRLREHSINETAKQYKVSSQTISNIRARKTWTDI